MPKNMAFSLTKKQMYAKTKDVTRRLGWGKLRTGEIICAVEKGQGLKLGEKVKVIGLIEIISVTKEALYCIPAADVIREGFPQMTARDFIIMFCKANKCEPQKIVNRIEFKHLY